MASKALLSPPSVLVFTAISHPLRFNVLSNSRINTTTCIRKISKRHFHCISSSSSSSSSSSRFSTQSPGGALSLDLLSASCYLPHPAKESTGGEDAHFISAPHRYIGVADGVGGWAEVGVNAGLYARELMSHSLSAIQDYPGYKDNEEGLAFIHPASVLQIAHSKTTAQGSSTACLLTLVSDQLHAVNLGDSGFILVRDGSTVFETPVQQHSFNFTFQLQHAAGGDLPSSGQVFAIPVASGDVIVAATDGLFDNLYNNEITDVVVHALKSGLGPQVAAQNIAALARKRALDKKCKSPFSTAAEVAGYRYYGGKLDDLTVVVSYITSSAAATL